MFLAVWLSCFLFVIFVLVLLALADFVKDTAASKDRDCPPLPECATGNSSSEFGETSTEDSTRMGMTTANVELDLSQRLLERVRSSRYQDCSTVKEKQSSKNHG